MAAAADARQPASGTPLGFYDGLAGLAWTLHRLGHLDRALALAELTLRQPWDDLAPPICTAALAGLGLALDALAAATGESGPAPTAPALRRARRPRHGRSSRDDGADAAATDRGRPAARSAGTALLFLRLYERTGDTALLDLAAEALHRDLARCVHSAGGTLQVDEGWRTMPYLGAGSVGIGMVLDDYLAHRAGRAISSGRGARSCGPPRPPSTRSPDCSAARPAWCST